jgi:HK97 family phage portal protein
VQGQETVLGLAAVYSAVRFIADAIASLPIKVYRQRPDGSSERIYSSMLLGSPIAGGGPQVSGTLYDWLFTGCTSALLWGNAWGLITNRSGIPGPDGQGLPTGIAWLPPDRMSVTDDEQQPENPFRAKIYYNGRLVEQSELVHMKAFSVAGRVEGISPIHAFSMLWSQGLETLKYSADWFTNGGFPPGTFQNISEEVDKSQADEIRRRLTDTIRLRQPLVYGRDWEYKPLTVPPNEATFIQAMQLNATQVAAIFGVRPQRVGGTRNDGLTYTNQTMDQLDELQNTLRPWLTRWEHLFTMLLPATQYAKFDTDALLKTDPHTRNQIYELQRTMGTRTQNEIRADDDLPKVVGGDDAIPLSVLQRMVTTTRAIPKALVPQVMLEVDHIAALLEEMQRKGLTAPPPSNAPAFKGTPLGAAAEAEQGQGASSSNGSGSNPPAMHEPGDVGNPGEPADTGNDQPAVGVTPEQYLGRLLTSERALLFGPPGAKATASDRKSAVTMLGEHARLGHLSDQEASARISRAFNAETTGQLAELFKGLPIMTDGVAPSVSRETFGPAGMRASDEDRARARKRITEAGAAGRLRQAEIDERNRKAGEAVTCGDLDTLLADLPASERAASPPEEGQVEAQPLFGPAAMVLLQKRATQFDMAGQLAAVNGKAH